MKKKCLTFIINKPKDSYIDNGHHKDFDNIRFLAKQNGYKVENINLSCLNLKKIMKIFKLFYLEREKKIIIGPIFRVPFLVFLPFRNPIFIYIADSPLKTAVISYKNTIKYLISIFYNMLLERLIRSDFKIVVSPEERIWFSSKLYSLHKTIIMSPIPYLLSDPILNEPVSKDYDILFYNPRAAGINLMLEIINNLSINSDKEFKITILGKIKDKKNIFKITNNKFKILNKEWESNVDLLILRAKCVIITDIGGSGFCNRAMQVRYLGTTLFSTIDGLRGTNLHTDKGVEICNSASEFVESFITYIHQTKSFNIKSKESELYTFKSKKQLKNLITKIDKI